MTVFISDMDSCLHGKDRLLPFVIPRKVGI